jgi:CubicO group peptidase (beta-lactamase class C family)
MEKQQFRVLYREFLFRMVDLEVLSSHAQGDSNKLLGQFATFLISFGILLSVGALAVGSIRSPAGALFYAWSSEHRLIAATMLMVGLFAVLSWDSTYPNRRDVLVLAPLPVRSRTLFLSKVAAVGASLALTVGMLHWLGGIVWPLALGLQSTPKLAFPVLDYRPAGPPAGPAELDRLLQRDLAPVLSPGIGVTVGVYKHGERRVLTYGAARADSIYQIASISKTFTALALAQMVVEGRVRLDEPVRELLPAGVAERPTGREITLLDLATHSSGIPPYVDNMPPGGISEYRTEQLYAWIAKHGLARDPDPGLVYSNLGYALLGQALALRDGRTYPELIAARIAGPLGLHDTATDLTPEQQGRLIQGYRGDGRPIPAWTLDIFNGSGGLRSTASDMLAYLEAQLRATTPAIRLSQQLGLPVAHGVSVALAWLYDQDNGTYIHNGALSGYTSYAFFNPREDYAAIVLVNQAPTSVTFADLLADHVRQRLTGKPTIALGNIAIPAGGSFLGMLRYVAVYWIVMLGAGAFIFCSVLGLQGVAAQLLPRRLFLRASSFLQLATFGLIVYVYFMQPAPASPRVLMEANGNGPLSWSPSYWFLGLFQQLNGSPMMAGLAHRAWIGLAAAISVTAVAYALSYFRTLRKIVEEPDIVSRTRGLSWLPRLGNSLQTALGHFSIRSLLRSRQHRVILAFYLGIGFALTILMVQTASEQRGAPSDAPIADGWSQVNTPLLAASIAMLCLWMIGTRVVFAFPLELRANWIFQVACPPSPQVVATRRALLLLSSAPVWAATAAIGFRVWPVQAATGHLLVLALLASLLADVCLYNFRKIPFTCSYLPGKSQVHLAILGAVGLLEFITFSVHYERQALAELRWMAPMLILLALAAAIARWFTVRAAHEPLKFEEEPSDTVQVLGLSATVK